MTEPIAIEVPGKPAFSRSTALPAGVGPLVEALAGAPKSAEPTAPPALASAAPKADPPKPAPAAPKVEPPKAEAPKVEPPKPAPVAAAAPAATAAVTAAATVAAAAVGVPAPVAAPAVGLLARFTRKQLTLGAAVCSLVVGAGALRLVLPSKGTPEPTPTAPAGNEKVAVSPTAPSERPAPTPNRTPEPTPNRAPDVELARQPDHGNTLPPFQVAPPNTPPGASKNTGLVHTPQPTPVAPAIHPDPRTALPAISNPDLGISVGPGTAGPGHAVVPAAFAPEPPAGSPPPAPGAGGPPPVPPPSSTVPLPALPPLPGATPPATETKPVPPPNLTPPAATPPPGAATKPPETPPMSGTPGAVPPPSMPAPPSGFGNPAVPAPSGVEPKLPALPDTKPNGGVTPPVLPVPPTGNTNTGTGAGAGNVPPPNLSNPPGHTPGVGMGTGAGTGNVPPPSLLPEVGPGSGVKPPAITEVKPPVVEPPAAALPPPGGTNFTKPAGATEPRPTVPDRAPKTSYDVDVYDAKDGDTYESISQEWYNNKQYAAALKAYNQNQALQGGRYVNIPPKHILQRQSPAGTGGTSGTSGLRINPPAADGPNWSATPAARAAGTSGRSAFITPRNGMTLQQVARETMGTEQRWRDIYDLNPQITKADAALPAGTELKLPADAKIP